MTRTQIEALRAAVEARQNIGGTHWHGCETDPMHRDCAIRRLLDAWDTRDAAHQEVARLREVLSNLLDKQNDAPLERHRASWQAAVDAGYAALATSEPQG